MERKRARRVAEAIQREVGDILDRRIRDPRMSAMVTVTRVDVSDDLRHARIFVSVLGNEREKEEAQRLLRGATRFIRSELASFLDLRVAPEISFALDESAENYLRIDEVLKKIHEEESDRGGERSRGGQEGPGS